MKIIYLGDVVGKSGRNAVHDNLDQLSRLFSPDFVIINGENSAHGFGITGKICRDFFEAGIDVITLGNHSWDQPDTAQYIASEPRLLRPLNFPENTPGMGKGIFSTKKGEKILVVQVMGQLFMPPVEDLFSSLELALKSVVLGKQVSAIVVDVHAEASSEKMAVGHFLDGRVSLVIGSHTHVPTADGQILPHGTAYQTDAGMCGDYNSIIGMKVDSALKRFTNKKSKPPLQPADGEGTICGVFLETDDKTGKAIKFCPIKLGGRLQLLTN